MGLLLQLLLKIVKAVPPSGEGAGIMSIIIPRPYTHLKKEPRSFFKRDKDVKIIVDRYFSERGTSQQTVEVERRLADQRQPKEELIEAVISA